jgi:hypothetical protein
VTGDEGYIVEFVRIGGSVKVTAFDPATLTEASIVGSPKASEKDLAELAIRKLHYVLAKGKDEA